MRDAEPAGFNPTRRDLMLLGVGLFAVVGFPAFRVRRRGLARRTLPVMGTIAELVVVDPDPRHGQGAISAALQRLQDVEGLLTRFRDDSEVGRANLAAGREAVPVGAATASVVRAGLAWAEATAGGFDPCLGRVAELWDVGCRTAPPPAAAFRRFAGRRLYRSLDLDTWRGRAAVRLTDRDAAIDLGGIGKGYGVDQAVHVLQEWGIRDAIVNVGGDLYAMGHSEDGDPWEIGIRSPEDPDGIVARFPVEDAAIATSGDYIQYFIWHGRRFHHLMDPATGEPTTSGMRSLTVRAATCMEADAAATAGFGTEAVLAPGPWRRETEIVHLIRA